eukprot:2366101-Amphidinium_carterae.1
MTECHGTCAALSGETASDSELDDPLAGETVVDFKCGAMKHDVEGPTRFFECFPSYPTLSDSKALSYSVGSSCGSESQLKRTMCTRSSYTLGGDESKCTVMRELYRLHLM